MSFPVHLAFRHGLKYRPVAFLLALLIANHAQGMRAAVGQTGEGDAAIRDRVLQLVDRLKGDKADVREAAEVGLIKLGPRILPVLPDLDSVKDVELKKRLERIRARLQEGHRDDPTKASLVNIQAKGIRLTEALQQLQKQTGNPITDLREQLGAEVTNPSFDLDLKGRTFHESLDEIARRAEVAINPLTGDGSVGIVAGPAPANPLVRYAGPFRVNFKQLAESRDFLAGTTLASAQLEVSWEPRLRPMLLALKSESLVIKDDQGRVIKPQLMMESTEVVLRPENPIAELNLNLEAPQRSATKLSVLAVKCDVTLPSGIKLFRFPSIVQEKVELKQGDVGVTLVNMEVDEQVWKVNVELAYPGEGPAFESYRQGLFNNRIWLQKPDGTRFEHNGGFSNTSSDGGKLGFEYLFVDAPGKPSDYGLVYETPSKVVTLPLEFEFKDVPLP